MNSKSLSLQILAEAMAELKPERVVYVNFDLTSPQHMRQLQDALQMVADRLGNVDQSISTQTDCRLLPEQGNLVTLVVNRVGPIVSLVEGVYEEYSTSQCRMIEWKFDNSSMDGQLSNAEQRFLFEDSTLGRKNWLLNICFTAEMMPIVSPTWIHSAFGYLAVCNSAMRTEIDVDSASRSILSAVEAHHYLLPNNSSPEISKIFRLRPVSTHRKLLQVLIQKSVDMQLICSAHHIIWDGISSNQLCLKFGQIIDSNSISLPPSQWQPFHVATSEARLKLHDTIQFWSEQMKQYEQYTLQYDKQNRGSTYDRQTILCNISSKTSIAVTQLMQLAGLNKSMVFAISLFVTLANSIDKKDIIISSIFSTRDSQYTQETIACMINIALLRFTLMPGSMHEFLQAARKSYNDAYKHRSFPFNVLIKNLKTLDSKLRFDELLFNCVDNAMHHDRIMQLYRFISTGVALFNWSFSYVEFSKFSCIVDYNCNSFWDITLKNFIIKQFVIIVGCANAFIQNLNQQFCRPSKLIHQVCSIGHTNRNIVNFDRIPEINSAPFKIQKKCNLVSKQFKYACCGFATAVSYSSAACLQLTSSSVGLSWTPSYVALVNFERGTQVVQVILALLQSSMAYAPVEPNYPTQRMQFITRTLNATINLSENDAPWKSSYALLRHQNYQLRHSGSDIAYVIHTSGTTGVPKGVCVGHRSIACLVYDTTSMFKRVDEEVLYLQTGTFVFDLSAGDIAMLLYHGCTMYIVKNPIQFVDELGLFVKPTYTIFVAAMMNSFAATQLKKICSSETVITVGECLQRSADEMNPELYLLNLYGPTEATVTSSGILMRYGTHQTSIGHIFPSECAVVLGKWSNPAGLLNDGELFIGGSGVALGYLHKPEQTQASFTINCGLSKETLIKYESECRKYATGDLVIQQPDGSLTFRGRLDHQVKINGYRVELLEIEHQILTCRNINIKECLVLPMRLKVQNLTAFIVPHGQQYDCNEIANNIKYHLHKILPKHMIPSVYICLPELPVTSTGKLDKQTLFAKYEDNNSMTLTAERMSSVNDSASKPAYVTLHRQGIHANIENIWSELLNPEYCKLDSDFFACGGDSVTLPTLQAMIKQQTHQHITIDDLLKNTTIESQCRMIESKLRQTGEQPANISQENSIEFVLSSMYCQLSNAEQRFLFVDSMMEQNSWLLNICFIAEIMPTTSPRWIHSAFCNLAVCHSAMRTKIDFESASRSILSAVEAHYTLFPNNLFTEISMQFKIPTITNHQKLLQVVILTSSVIQKSLCVHHIIWDGVSCNKFHLQFCNLINSTAVSLLPRQCQPYHFAASEAQLQIHQTNEFWAEQLREYEQYTLQYDKQNKGSTYDRQTTLCNISNTTSMAVTQLMQLAGLTKSMIFAISLFVTLAYSIDKQDIIISSVFSTRDSQSAQEIIACMINIALLRFTLMPGSMHEFLQAARKSYNDAYKHRGFQVYDLIKSQRAHDGRVRFVEVLYNFVDKLLQPEKEMQLLQFVSTGVTLFNWSFSFIEISKLSCIIDFNCNSFWKSSLTSFIMKQVKFIANMSATTHHEQFCSTFICTMLTNQLHSMSHNKSINVRCIDKIHEINAIVYTQQKTSVALSKHNRHAYSGFATAVSSSSAVCLQLASSSVALLWTSSFVALVNFERGITVVKVILALLQSSVVYSPVEPNYPTQRTQLIIRNLNATIKLIEKDAMWKSSHTLLRHQNYQLRHSGSDIAYVIHTSGTTGVPKGVCVGHRSLACYVYDITDTFKRLNDKVLYLQTASFVFDVSAGDIAILLYHGCTLYIVKNPIQSGDEMDRFVKPTHTFVVTAALNSFTATQLKKLCSPEIVITIGECVQRSVDEMNPELYLLNLYGPTEATVASSGLLMSYGAHQTSIGHIFPSECAVVLGKWSNPAGLLNDGELFIGGSGLALGYLHKPEQTQASFTINCGLSKETLIKYESECRKYATGDLVNQQPDGSLTFRGRLDHQVKIYGYRVELLEIEHQILACTDCQICECVVLPVMKDIVHLTAFIVPTPMYNDCTMIPNNVQHQLHKLLPSYMIPTNYICLPKLPVTSNGKLDRNVLLSQCNKFLLPKNIDVGTSDSIISCIIDQWNKLLPKQCITGNESIFQLGGSSLTILKLQSHYLSEFGCSISIPELFANLTANKLGHVIKEKTKEQALHHSSGLLNKKITDTHTFTDGFELTTAQKRIWLFEYMEKRQFSRAVVLMHYVGILNDLAVKHGAQLCVQINESLRTRIPNSSHNSINLNQQILSSTEAYIDLFMERKMKPSINESALGSQIPVLLQLFSLITNAVKNTVLVSSLHHIIMDAVSLTELYHQFSNFYLMSLHNKMSHQWQTTKYWQFLECEHDFKLSEEHAIALSFWKAYLASYDVVKLPVDIMGNRLIPITKGIQFSCTVSGFMSVDMLPNLIFAWFCILTNLCVSTEIVIGLPVYGRPMEIAKIDSVIGCFINVVLLRLQLNNTYMTNSMLRHYISNQITMCIEHSRIPYEIMIQCINSSEQPCPFLLNYISGVNSNYVSFLASKSKSTVNMIASSSTVHEIVLDAHGNQKSHTIEGSLIHNCMFYSENIRSLLFTQSQLLIGLTDYQGVPITLSVVNQHKLLTNFTLPTENGCMDLPENVCSNCQLHNGTQYFRLDETSIMMMCLSRRAICTGSKVCSDYQINHGHIMGHEAAFCCQVERGLCQFLGCIASLLTSLVYVPFDLKSPKWRQHYILEQCSAMETENYDAKNLHFAASAPRTRASTCDLVYIIFTSGSTGMPKGVCITKSAYSQTVSSTIHNVSAQPFSLMLQQISCVFDGSMLDFSFILSNGCSLIILEHSQALSSTLIKENFESCVFVTNVLNIMPKSNMNVLGMKLSQVMVGGESLFESAYRLSSCYGMQVVSLYGPTETTICSAKKVLRTCDVGKNIGKPLLREFAYIQNNNSRLSNLGILCITGSSVSRGYISKSNLTIAAFQTNAIASIEQVKTSTCQTAYITGDAAKYLPDGNLYYLGRFDSQIKLYGYRIEVSEIEQNLAKLSCIVNCCIVHTTVNGHATLIAFYVANSTHKSYEECIMKHMRTVLPSFMVPRIYIQLQEMPFTATGKLDRKKLISQGTAAINAVSQMSENTSEGGNSIAPAAHESKIGIKTLEEKIAKIWRTLFSVDRIITKHDDYFSLGGTSLDVIKLWGMYQAAGINISLSETHQYSKLHKLLDFLSGPPTLASQTKTSLPVQNLLTGDTSGNIAIVGIAGMFSNSINIDMLWDAIIEGKEDSIMRSNGVNKRGSFVAAVGHMPKAKQFDPPFWDISKSDAKLLDPQVRKLLEIGFIAIENSGLAEELQEHICSTYMGCGHSYYYDECKDQRNQEDLMQWKLIQMNRPFTPATMFSHKIGLTGAAIGLDTACSTSLVALYEACMALRNNECDIAIAGASSFALPSTCGYTYVPDGILSSDGYCRPFDMRATGTVPGAGAVCAVLQKVAISKTNAIAIIKGIAVNNDGLRQGYTKPTVVGQQKCIQRSLTDACIHPADISFVECHGTGTLIGDPIEIQALHAAHTAFGPHARNCILGSIKANIGHTDSASGLAGVAKLCKMFHEQRIPPQLHFEKLNPHIAQYMEGYSICTSQTHWHTNSEYRYAGISSFGIGGTNSHSILSTSNVNHVDYSTNQNSAIFPLSAKTMASLEALKEKFSSLRHISESISTMSHLARGRKRFAYKTACFSCLGIQEPFLDSQKSVFENQAVPLTLIYPGQGLALNLADLIPTAKEGDLFPEFYNTINECLTALTNISGIDANKLTTKSENMPHEEKLRESVVNRTAWLQPLVIALEMAITVQLKQWKFNIELLLGHSLGEYAALFCAGVFNDINDLLFFVYTRGCLMQHTAKGSMLIIQHSSTRKLSAPFEDLRAVTNPSGYITLSGSTAEITSIEQKLSASNLWSMYLPVGKAFHSKLMESILPSLQEAIFCINLHTPSAKTLSNVSGHCLSSSEAINPNYLVCHARHTVRFQDCIKFIQRQDSETVLVETGPGKTFTKLLNSATVVIPSPILSVTLGDHGSHVVSTAVLQVLCNLWINGIELPWEEIFPLLRHSPRNNTQSMPNYCFDEIECWLPHPPSTTSASRLLQEDMLQLTKSDYFNIMWTSDMLQSEDEFGEVKPKFMVIAGGTTTKSVVSYIKTCGNAVTEVNIPRQRKGHRTEYTSDYIDDTVIKTNAPDIILLINEKTSRMRKAIRNLTFIRHRILAYCTKKTSFYTVCWNQTSEIDPLDLDSLFLQMEAISNHIPIVNTAIVNVIQHNLRKVVPVLFAELMFSYANHHEPAYITLCEGKLCRQEIRLILSQYRLSNQNEQAANSNMNEMQIHIQYSRTVSMIATAFSEVLGTSNNLVSADTSFFELGGSSLSGIGLVEQLKNMFNSPLHLNDLLNNSSPSALAYFIMNTDELRDCQILIPLKTSAAINVNNSNGCVVIIHAAGGCLFNSRVFCDIIPQNCAYYGIQYPYTLQEAADEAAELGLDSLAALYVAKLLELITPEKQLILMGASLGGTIAYEMRLQLIQQNFPSPLVIAFDSWAKFPVNLIDEIDTEVRERQTMRITSLLKEPNQGRVPNALAGAIVSTMLRLMGMLLKYEVKPMPKPNTSKTSYLFKATVLDEMHRKIDCLDGNSSDNYWAEVADCQMAIAAIESDHYDILEEPNVDPIKAMLKNIISEYVT